MGFTIFESSGTFNPVDYGLVPGDLLHLVVVGGGGGGCGAANLFIPGKAGGASSFGNILTAAGGLSPTDSNFVSPTTGSCRGASGVYGSYGGLQSANITFFGGNGADGWVPGVWKGRHGNHSNMEVSYKYTGTGTKSSISQFCFSEGKVVNFVYFEGLVSAIPSSPQLAGSGGIYVDIRQTTADSSSYTIVAGAGGAGGIGYGAGGGGGCAFYDESLSTRYINLGAGGNSGVIAQKDYVLTSTNAIAVTVGTGGAGGSGYAGGAGANGCVAIFW